MAALGKCRRFIAWVALAGAIVAARANVPHTSAELKAAYLFNFASFVEWPNDALAPGEPFRIAVCGAPEIADALESVTQGEKVRGHPVQVIRVSRTEEAPPCPIVYVAPGAEPAGELARLNGKPVLTAGDDERFESRGGIIRFVAERNRIKLRINLAEAVRCGLRISSQLLRIAEVRDPS